MPVEAARRFQSRRTMSCAKVVAVVAVVAAGASMTPYLGRRPMYGRDVERRYT